MMLKKVVAATMATLIGTGALAAETVKVAFIDMLSGPLAQTGQSSLQQLREVVNRLNADAASTDPQLEIVPFDGKGSPEESLNVLRAATDRGIRYVTQGASSSVAAALVGQLNKMAEREPEKTGLLLNYSAMDPALTNKLCSFWHFRFFPSSEDQMDALTSFLVDRPEVRKVYLVNQNYTHGQQVSSAFVTYLSQKKPSATVVGNDFVPIGGTKDFAPYIAKIKASGADTVVTSNWGADLSLLLKAASEAGLDVNFYTMAANAKGIPTQMGSNGLGKVRVMWNSGMNPATAQLESFADAYRKKYNEDLVYTAHWDTMSMLRGAIVKAKSTDPVRVGLALEDMKATSLVGPVQMRKADHQLMAPIFLAVWAKKDGVAVKNEAEGTGNGFRTEAVWDFNAKRGTTCEMVRPTAK